MNNLFKIFLILPLVLISSWVSANKNLPKKEKTVKTATSKNYIDSMRIVTLSKTVSTKTDKRNYYIEKKENQVQNADQLKLIWKYAEKMKVPTASISNLNLYSFIDSWYGTRYVYGGTSRRGIDCSAFVRQLYKDVFGTDILRTSIMQYSTVKKIHKIESLKEGDLIFFNTLGRGVSHVGVYLKNGYFVHSSSSRGVNISSLKSGYWKSKYISGGRIL